MLTVDLSAGGEHEVAGQIRLFESNQATFARHKACNRGYECVAFAGRVVTLFELSSL